MNKLVEQNIGFELLSHNVSEITDKDAWKVSDNVVALSDDVVHEMTKGDDDPFFVEFVGLYEGLSNNDRIYSVSAVKSCVDAMVGVNMYKGHEEPGTQGWKYREPVGRIVAAREQMIDVDGKQVLAAVGKAYITDSDKKLRADIKKKMAGSVSILGNARMIRNGNETTRTVVHLKKPLKSVDFCNPGTGGLAHAGVTAVVSEMVVTTIEPETVTEEKMTKKLTKEELLAEYKTEIMALVGEQSAAEIQEIANSSRELARQREQFKDEKSAMTAEVAEMKNAAKAAQDEAASWKQRYEAERDARFAADLKVYMAEQVAEMKAKAGNDARLVEVASKRVTVKVVDGDLEKSKTALRNSFDAAYAEVAELAEMVAGEAAQPARRSHTDNPPARKAGTKLDALLAPNLAESRAKRPGN